jgi:hypothetical protein
MNLHPRINLEIRWNETVLKGSNGRIPKNPKNLSMETNLRSMNFGFLRIRLASKTPIAKISAFSN